MVLEALSTGAGVADELAALAERVRPSVVEVRSRGGSGAGTIWTADGLIVTNDHVAPDDEATVVLADGRRIKATATRRDRARDLVALQVAASDLPAAAIGDAGQARVGHIVLAVGNPYGQPRVVTAGIISGPRDGGHGRLRWRDGIQAGIELRPGNSGGPLVNVTGEVIAVNSMVIGPRLALSIPSTAVAAMLGAAGPLRLGLRVQQAALPVRTAALTGQQSGLLVSAVDDDGAADRAGLLPGDLLVAVTSAPFGGAPVLLLEPGDLAQALRRAGPGTPLTIRVSRGGTLLDVSVPAGAG
jgi:serine protease Do